MTPRAWSWPGTNTPGLKPLNKYRWNGKEFQPDLGLNWTQLDWRMVDPQLGGGFHSVDPEVENGQESMSPYAFGFDNAVRYNDPDGRCPVCPVVLPFLPEIGAAAGAVIDAVLGTAAGAALGHLITKGFEAGGSARSSYIISDEPIYTSQAQYAARYVAASSSKSPSSANTSSASANGTNPEGKKGKRDDGHKNDFDQAREAGFKKAGMTDPNKVKFTKVDPKTGTVVEFKDDKTGKVVYDSPHDEPGPGHDKPHVGFQQGKGREQAKGNIEVV